MNTSAVIKMPVIGYKLDISQFIVTQLLLNFLSNAMFLCGFHGHLEQTQTENCFQSK